MEGLHFVGRVEDGEKGGVTPPSTGLGEQPARVPNLGWIS